MFLKILPDGLFTDILLFRGPIKFKKGKGKKQKTPMKENAKTPII